MLEDPKRALQTGLSIDFSSFGITDKMTKFVIYFFLKRALALNKFRTVIMALPKELCTMPRLSVICYKDKESVVCGR